MILQKHEKSITALSFHQTQHFQLISAATFLATGNLRFSRTWQVYQVNYN